MIPEDAVDKAAAAFHDALDTHLDAPLASHHRETDWVTAPVI